MLFKKQKSIYWLTKLLIIVSYIKYRISFQRNLRKKEREGEKEGERKDYWIFGSILLAQGNFFCKISKLDVVEIAMQMDWASSRSSVTWYVILGKSLFLETVFSFGIHQWFSNCASTEHCWSRRWINEQWWSLVIEK